MNSSPTKMRSYQEQEQNLIDTFKYLLEKDEEDGMIRWEVFKLLTKFTYDDQMRDIQTIDQVHVHAEDG